MEKKIIVLIFYKINYCKVDMNKENILKQVIFIILVWIFDKENNLFCFRVSIFKYFCLG